MPNIYKADEPEEVRAALADAAKKEGVDDTPQTISSFPIERVRNNLHIVLCMSPVGEAFRNRIHMYPAFVNCTTIDWFSEWPADALLEVADKYLQFAARRRRGEQVEAGAGADVLTNPPLSVHHVSAQVR